MARYIGPKTKIARRFGDPIFGVDKVFNRKGSLVSRGRKKISEYSIQLQEKQKTKYTYGLLERQFLNLFKKASCSRGITGEIFLQLLESRLDNVVYRIGLAKTRGGARQLVSHKHVVVDGKVMNIASYLVKPGQTVGIRERDKSMKVILDSLDGINQSKYSWIEYDKSTMSAKYLHVPKREDISENIKEQLIVELYSK